MSSIQKFAEELVNLSVKEVNELAMIIKHDNMDIPAVHYEHPEWFVTTSPKEYGMKLLKRKRK